MRQIQLLTARNRDRGAKHATCVFQHEVDLLRRNFLSGDNQVALILAILVIYHNDKLSLAEIGYSLFNGVQCNLAHIYCLFIIGVIPQQM